MSGSRGRIIPADALTLSGPLTSKMLTFGTASCTRRTPSAILIAFARDKKIPASAGICVSGSRG
ncbi:MAG: hypothetical protein VW874_10955, partial [Gammaproteobacteria bacterium]